MISLLKLMKKLVILLENIKQILSIRIADAIDLNKNEPYIEILEILEDSVFVAKKAKIFEEEKKVAIKAPVNSISISDLNQTQSKVPLFF